MAGNFAVTCGTNVCSTVEPGISKLTEIHYKKFSSYSGVPNTSVVPIKSVGRKFFSKLIKV